jgi:hypothetical protein
MKFRKKPIVIEAIQWDGTNGADIDIWSSGQVEPTETGSLMIATLEGILEVSLNDWIIKGIKGEFYPCKPDIFEATYEVVDA